MKEKSNSINIVILGSIALLTQFTFLIISPRMYEVYPKAFWLFIVGHILLSMIFNADEYLLNSLLYIEDPEDTETEQAQFDVLKIVLMAIILLFMLGGFIYVFIKSPRVFFFHVIADLMEEALLFMRKKVFKLK